MSYFDKALDAFSELQDELTSLIGQAAAAGEYDDVARIARLAGGVKDAVGRLDGVAGDSKPPDGGPSVDAEPATAEHGEKGRRALRARDYPRFERERDRLVKVGWSKRDRRSYEHRAPREVVEVVHSTPRCSPRSCD